MAITNLNNKHLDNDQLNNVINYLNALESIINPYLVNLTPQERQQYGSVNEQNKLIINKVKEYRDMKPNLSSPDIDWEEFARDFNSRNALEGLINRFQLIAEGLKSAKTLHDWDNYQAALTDYGYTQYKRGSGAPGYDVKQEEIKQFFNKTAIQKESKS